MVFGSHATTNYLTSNWITPSNHTYNRHCPVGQTDTYMSSDTTDPRNGKCVIYTSDPPQVETKDHYTWRIAKPIDESDDPKVGGGIVMIILGCIAMFINWVVVTFAHTEDSGFSTDIIVGIVISLLLIGLIIGGVFMMKAGQDSISNQEDTFNASVTTWQGKEPTPTYEATATPPPA